MDTIVAPSTPSQRRAAGKWTRPSTDRRGRAACCVTPSGTACSAGWLPPVAISVAPAAEVCEKSDGERELQRGGDAPALSGLCRASGREGVRSLPTQQRQDVHEIRRCGGHRPDGGGVDAPSPCEQRHRSHAACHFEDARGEVLVRDEVTGQMEYRSDCQCASARARRGSCHRPGCHMREHDHRDGQPFTTPSVRSCAKRRVSRPHSTMSTTHSVPCRRRILDYGGLRWPLPKAAVFNPRAHRGDS